MNSSGCAARYAAALTRVVARSAVYTYGSIGCENDVPPSVGSIASPRLPGASVSTGSAFAVCPSEPTTTVGRHSRVRWRATRRATRSMDSTRRRVMRRTTSSATPRTHSDVPSSSGWQSRPMLTASVSESGRRYAGSKLHTTEPSDDANGSSSASTNAAMSVVQPSSGTRSDTGRLARSVRTVWIRRAPFSAIHSCAVLPMSGIAPLRDEVEVPSWTPAGSGLRRTRPSRCHTACTSSWVSRPWPVGVDGTYWLRPKAMSWPRVNARAPSAAASSAASAERSMRTWSSAAPNRGANIAWTSAGNRSPPRRRAPASASPWASQLRPAAQHRHPRGANVAATGEDASAHRRATRSLRSLSATTSVAGVTRSWTGARRFARARSRVEARVIAATPRRTR